MRDTTKLHPKLQEKIAEFLHICNKKGLKVRITECLRTKEEQDALYAQGRTKPGSIITNCSGSSYASMHQWGVASDFCRNDGNGAFNDSDGFFTKVGRIGQACGLEWGGSWNGFVDKPHLQLPDWGSTAAKLKAAYKNPETFMATWEKTKIQDFADLTDAELKKLLKHRTGIKSLQAALGLPKTGYPDKLLLSKCPKIPEDAKDTMPEVVKALQYMLKNQGYDVVVNGNYGRRTKEAVVKFKIGHDINANSASVKAAGPFWRKLLVM